jgi:hypothetical protein
LTKREKINRETREKERWLEKEKKRKKRKKRNRQREKKVASLGYLGQCNTSRNNPNVFCNSR